VNSPASKSGRGEGMDARVEATREPLPDGRSRMRHASPIRVSGSGQARRERIRTAAGWPAGRMPGMACVRRTRDRGKPREMVFFTGAEPPRLRPTDAKLTDR